MSKRSIMCLAVVIAGFLLGGMHTSAEPAHARSHLEGRGAVPAVVARILPAVVSITTSHIEQKEEGEPAMSRGLGSGIIVDRRGYILTNSHEYVVHFSSRREADLRGAVEAAWDPSGDRAIPECSGLTINKGVCLER